MTPTGTTSWSYPLASSHLTSGHVYTVIETVTDSGGNTSTTTNTFTYQATAPTVSITTPSASGYGANYPTAWSGTATPASPLSLSSTTLTILNSTTGKPTGPARLHQLTAVNLATGGTPGAWTYAGPAASSLVSGDSYTVTATSTDSGGNTGTASSSFTYVTTAPTGTIAYPATGSTYGANYSTAWSGTSSATSPLSPSSVTLTIKNTTANTYWNGSAFTRRPPTCPPAGRRGPGPTPDPAASPAWSQVTATR